MRARLFVLVLVLVPVLAQTQTALPPDINPVTLSRLPPVTPEDLDEEGRKLLAKNPVTSRGRDPPTSRATAPAGAALESRRARTAPLARATFSSRCSSSRGRSTSRTSGPRTSPRA